MGDNHSKTFEDLKLGGEWQKIGEEQAITLVRNSFTKVEGEMRVIMADPRVPQEKQFQIYNYRRTQDEAQVAAYAVEVLQSKSIGMCGSQQEYKVITQRISRRLNQLPQLSFKESLYILSESLRGYRGLYVKVGSFEVNSSMIGVNTQGQARVWLNQNFAQNHPATQKPYLQTTSVASRQGSGVDQAYMVREICEVVEEKCQDGRFSKQFRSRIGKKDNFVDAYCQIQKYCQQKGMWIPDRIPLNSSVTLTKTRSPLELQGVNQVESVQFIRQPQQQQIRNFPNFDRDTFIRNLTISNGSGHFSPRDQARVEVPPLNYSFNQRGTSSPLGSVAPQVRFNTPSSPIYRRF